MRKKSTPPAIAAIDRATSAYLESIAQTRRQGNATEHSYRPALKTLLEAHFPGWEAVNEPVRQECGAPDFVVQKNGVALGYVEAKDVTVNLDKAAESPQMERYCAALPNLILTNYVEFRHYLNGNLQPGAEDLSALLKAFANFGASGQGVSPSAEDLAKLMAGKTRLLRDLVEKTAADPNSELAGIYQGLREYLIRDLTLPDFADIFAQTAAYGFFAARLESERQGAPEFSRLQAGALLPQTTPFLRRFFNAFVGADIDERISWMVDDIAKMFSTVSLDNVVRAFNLGGGQADDPFLHFYETFLHAYDSEKKAALGVYFTPLPVVDFIVRAVDHSLIHDFKIPNGLASESTAKFQGRKKHKVQILDPAAGTGAFLACVAELVRKRVKKNAGEGGWKSYAPEHLLPRLHGFEIMMSAYAMCHLKMALTLGDSVGGLFQKARGHRDFRVNVFLTSALDAPKNESGNLKFLQWLRDESDAADRVKDSTPVMVVLGNPPYNASSQNRDDRIIEQLKVYKHGLGVENEANVRPLSDDYIKFIRNAEIFIEKNGRGIVAMITNNSFYDGIIHRQMRKHLLETFDTIRILNLHGDANIRERAPDGHIDQNVFNIMQGVGIFIMAKTGKKAKGKNAQVFYAKQQGDRKMKYEFLMQESVNSVEWKKLRPTGPNFLFVPTLSSKKSEYEKGVSIDKMFAEQSSGVATSCDKLSVQFDRESLETVIHNFTHLSVHELKKLYPQRGETSAWTFQSAKDGLRDIQHFVVEMSYRPFDIRHSVIAKKSGGFIERPRYKIMRHFIERENIGLALPRRVRGEFSHGFVSKNVVELKFGDRYTRTTFCPLWVWKREDKAVGEEIPYANFNKNVAGEFAKRMGMEYSEKGKGQEVVSPKALFDYIYAVLHRPSYRRDFAEFLRVDFPRIPAATDRKEFWRMSVWGGKLRELHLLESPLLDGEGHLFSANGENKVDQIRFAPDSSSGGVQGRVYINAKRYFAGVPLVAWKYCVGGYYPAQKWLQDRKGRSLTFGDQRHYSRILSALAQTAELVEKLDGK